MEKLKGNDQVTCECGKRLLYKHYDEHLKTQFHIKYCTRDNQCVYYCGFNDKCKNCILNKEKLHKGYPCDKCVNKYMNKYKYRYI